MKDKIYQLINSSISYANCNNCNYDKNVHKDICWYCKVGSCRWEVSKDLCRFIADNIMDVVNNEKSN